MYNQGQTESLKFVQAIAEGNFDFIPYTISFKIATYLFSLYKIYMYTIVTTVSPAAWFSSKLQIVIIMIMNKSKKSFPAEGLQGGQENKPW